ncbi:MAG: helix-turn-helix domain-containing protein [Hyphomicrobiales bacterium]
MLKGGGLRLRAGNYRIIFEKTEDEIIVTKIGPRGDIYGRGAFLMNEPKPQILQTPSGEDLVVLTREEFEDLVDARDHADAVRAVSTGAMETLTNSELDDLLSAATPLAFWRKRRRLTQSALARAVGVTQPYLAQIETAKRTGHISLHAKLARALGIAMEDLLALRD